MGWLFTEGQTKRDLIQHLTADDDRTSTVRRCVRGSTLWVLHESNTTGTRFIVGYLMLKDPDTGWGFKDVSEEAGPMDHSCPEGYLDMASEPPNDTAARWRDRVRSSHAHLRQRRAAA